MGRGIHKLAARTVDTLKIKGRYSDGAGLYLIVKNSGSKQWVYRWTEGKRRPEMGLGGYPKVSLRRARQKAEAARDLVSGGINPIRHRRDNIIKTFGEAADELLIKLEADWNKEKNREAWARKNKQQWNRSLVHYCKPIRSIPIRDIHTQDILKVLEPLWEHKYETGRKTRARIERVFGYATANGWYKGENPARWKHHLKDTLPKRDGNLVKHFEAMPYEDIPAFIQTIHDNNTVPKLALEFTILTAARTGEALGATWSEINLESNLWTIPSHRMKSMREHKVPLSNRAVEIISQLKKLSTSNYIFPGQRPNKPLSNMSMAMVMRRMDLTATVHGFRSSFRDWCGDKTNCSREVAEAALAHSVGNSVEQSYRRRDALEKRQALMQKWSNYCSGIKNDNIIPLRA